MSAALWYSRSIQKRRCHSLSVTKRATKCAHRDVKMLQHHRNYRQAGGLESLGRPLAAQHFSERVTVITLTRNG
jgi:hypothetical protein